MKRVIFFFVACSTLKTLFYYFSSNYVKSRAILQFTILKMIKDFLFLMLCNRLF